MRQPFCLKFDALLTGKGTFIPSACSDGVAIIRWIRGTATVAGYSAIKPIKKKSTTISYQHKFLSKNIISFTVKSLGCLEIL